MAHIYFVHFGIFTLLIKGTAAFWEQIIVLAKYQAAFNMVLVNEFCNFGGIRF
jgi:hypothetical protein